MIFSLKLISVFVGDRQMSFSSLRIASRYVPPTTMSILLLLQPPPLRPIGCQSFFLWVLLFFFTTIAFHSVLSHSVLSSCYSSSSLLLLRLFFLFLHQYLSSLFPSCIYLIFLSLSILYFSSLHLHLATHSPLPIIHLFLHFFATKPSHPFFISNFLSLFPRPLSIPAWLTDYL